MTELYLKDHLASPNWGQQIESIDPVEFCVGKKIEEGEVRYRDFTDIQEMRESGYENLSINDIYNVAQSILNSTDEEKRPIVERNVKALYSIELEKLETEYEEANGLLPNIIKIASYILFPLFWIGAFIQEGQDAAKANLNGFMDKVWPTMTTEMINKSLKPFEETKPVDYFNEMLNKHILNQTIDQVTIEASGGGSIQMPGNIVRDFVRLPDLRLNDEDLIKETLTTSFEKVAKALDENPHDAPLTKAVLLAMTQVGFGDIEALNFQLGFTWDQMLRKIKIDGDRLTLTTTALVYQKDMTNKEGVPPTLGAMIFKRKLNMSITAIKSAIKNKNLYSYYLIGKDSISDSLLVRKAGESTKEMPTLINTHKKTLNLTPDEAMIILKGVESTSA